MSLFTRNYFRVGEEYARGGQRKPTATYYFFDDEDALATEQAYGAALRDATHRKERICMYRPPRHEGPYDDVQVIGFRRVDVVRNDPTSDGAQEMAKLLDLFTRRRSLPEAS